jgi:Tol biopolymer transport system component
MKLANRWLVVALALLPATLSGQLDPKTYPHYTKLFSVDTVGWVQFAQLSPNERWIAMVVRRGEGSALFLGRMGTKELVRVTDDGHRDDQALWFPAGNRLAFVSDRPDRDGVKNFYGMVIDIDASTGRPQGAPRQVTLDSVSQVQPTPDGKSLAVATAGNPNAIELVPATGGTARILTKLTGRGSHLGFTPDGKAVTYSVFRPRNDVTIERVAMSPAGTKPDTLVKSRLSVRLFPADQRFAVLDDRGDGERYRPMQRLDGTLVDSLHVHPRMRGLYKAADGRGYMVALDTGGGRAIAVVSTTGGGAPRTISPPAANTYPVGWLSDGSALVAVGDRYNGAGREKLSLVDVIPVSGGPTRTFQLKDAGMSPYVGVLGNELTYSAFGTPPGDTARRLMLMAIDLRTGSVRTVSSNLGPRFVISTAGTEVGTPRGRIAWAERVGQEIHIFSEQPGGAPQLLHSFPVPFRTPGGLYVHGDRMLWGDPRGDTTAIMTVDNATSEPRVLALLPSRLDDVSGVAWSYDGQRLALTTSVGGRSTLFVYDVPIGRAAAAPRVIQLAGQVFEIGWLPGNEVLVAGASGLVKGGRQSILRISASTGMVTVLNRDDPNQLDGAYAVSPDGKSIAYGFAGSATGTIIYRSDFTSLIPKEP